MNLKHYTLCGRFSELNHLNLFIVGGTRRLVSMMFGWLRFIAYNPGTVSLESQYHLSQ